MKNWKCHGIYINLGQVIILNKYHGNEINWHIRGKAFNRNKNIKNTFPLCLKYKWMYYAKYWGMNSKHENTQNVLKPNQKCIIIMGKMNTEWQRLR